MEYDKLRYFQLVKLSQDYESAGKSMYHENRQALLELLDYKGLMEDHIFFENKDSFILLFNSLIEKGIYFEEFRGELLYLIKKNEAISRIFQKDFEKVETFKPDLNLIGFSNTIQNILLDLEIFEPESEEVGKKWLMDSVKKTLLEIKNY